MKVINRYTLIIFFALISFNHIAIAQCTKALKDAENEYEKGRLLDIPNNLEYCLNSNSFSKEETIRAYKLLTLVFIFSDQEKKAEEALIKLLKADPEHELQEQFDPAEIFYLYDKFNVDPIFRIGGRIGLNSSRVNVIDEFNVFSTNQVTRSYANRLGFTGELSIEKYLKKGIEINAGFQASISSFNVVDIATDFNAFGERTVIFSTDISESQLSLKLPVFVRYNLNYESKEGITPFVLAGTAFNYLLDARLIDSQRQGGTSRTANNVSLLVNNERKQYNVSAFLGAGVKFRSKRVHFFSIEARYEISFLNYVNPENRFSSSLSTFGLTYVPDNLSLNHLSILFGYTRSIYNPKKKKEYL